MLTFKILFKKILSKIGQILSFIIPKNKNIIFFADNNGNFNSNTKYLYLYVSKYKKNIKAYWLTSNLKVYEILKKKNLKTVYTKSLKIFFLAPRAKFFFGISVKPTNYLNLFTYNCLKINLWHGFGPRSTFKTPKFKNRYKVYNVSYKNLLKSSTEWDYFIASSDFTAKRIAKKEFNYPEKKIKIFGSPRCDFILNRRSLFYNSTTDFKKKIIFYAPTWRAKFRDNFKILDLINKKDFFYFLEKNNFIFLFNIHPIFCDKIFTNKIFFNLPENIKFIAQDPFFDINELAPKISILISDYSSLVTDFLFLKKKVIFYLHDYSFYYKKVGLIDDFRKNLPGREITNYEDLKKQLLNKNFYNKNIKFNIKLFLKKYYDIKYKNSSKQICKFFLK